MANTAIKFLKGQSANLASKAIADGQILFTTDTGIIYLDNGATRQELYKTTFKNAEYKNNKLVFYHDEAKTDTTPVEIDLPAEQFLDTVKTQFVDSFAWSSTTYPGSTNPNLEGKPVLVLALKDTKNTNDESDDAYSYSFLNMEKLVDSDKADKIAITAADATAAAAQEDEIVLMHVEGDGSAADPYKGNIKQSGKKIGTAVRADGTADDNTIPTEKAVRTELEKKANIVDSGTEDNFVSLDANGDIQDSGFSGGTNTLTALASASDKVLATEKAVATELDKKVNAPTAAVTDETIAVFDGTDGKKIKSTGKSVVTTIDADAAGGADDNSIPTELAVRTELDKKTDKLTVTGSDTLAAHENEIVLYDNAGNIKTSAKKTTTTVRAALDSNDDPLASDDLIPTEKAIRAAIDSAAADATVVWGTF